MPSSIPFLQGLLSPLVTILPRPSASPFELYTRIASPQHPSFLIESVNGRTTMGRYSFFAVDPYEVLIGKADAYFRRTMQGHEVFGSAPFGHLARLIWSGDIDLNILIRTLAMRDGKGHLQVEAGIGADSKPAREYEETIHNAQAFFSTFS